MKELFCPTPALPGISPELQCILSRSFTPLLEKNPLAENIMVGWTPPTME